jgi:hypothetical protein
MAGRQNAVSSLHRHRHRSRIRLGHEQHALKMGQGDRYTVPLIYHMNHRKGSFYLGGFLFCVFCYFQCRRKVLTLEGSYNKIMID